MIIKVSGLLVDKYSQVSLDKRGQEKRTLKAVIYQKESHQAITITVEAETYQKIEELKTVTINCQLGSFVSSSGQAIQYFKEVA